MCGLEGGGAAPVSGFHVWLGGWGGSICGVGVGGGHLWRGCGGGPLVAWVWGGSICGVGGGGGPFAAWRVGVLAWPPLFRVSFLLSPPSLVVRTGFPVSLTENSVSETNLSGARWRSYLPCHSAGSGLVPRLSLVSYCHATAVAWCWLRFGSPVIPCELLPCRGAGSSLVPRLSLVSYCYGVVLAPVWFPGYPL